MIDKYCGKHNNGICSDCAKKLGGYGGNLVCTISLGICDVCGEKKDLFSWLDYDWPDGTRHVFD